MITSFLVDESLGGTVLFLCPHILMVSAHSIVFRINVFFPFYVGHLWTRTDYRTHVASCLVQVSGLQEVQSRIEITIHIEK